MYTTNTWEQKRHQSQRSRRLLEFSWLGWESEACSLEREKEKRKRDTFCPDIIDSARPDSDHPLFVYPIIASTPGSRIPIKAALSPALAEASR